MTEQRVSLVGREATRPCGAPGSVGDLEVTGGERSHAPVRLRPRGAGRRHKVTWTLTFLECYRRF